MLLHQMMCLFISRNSKLNKMGSSFNKICCMKVEEGNVSVFFLITFCGPFIVIYLRNKDQQDNLLSFVD